MMTTQRLATLVTLAAMLAACAHAPSADAPSAPLSAQFKETPPGWIEAAPADTLERGPWWSLFGDPVLDALAPKVEVSNQDIAAAAAAYAQARALVREQRASLFPSLSLSGSASRSGGERASTSSAGGGGASNNFQLDLGASWEPDVWGRIGGAVSAAGAQAQASAADLAAARLSAQAEFVTDYLSLREAEAEATLLRSTIEGYSRSLQIAKNRYDAGVAPKSDVLQAQTQLANAQADLAALERQRGQLEHAMAVLSGQAPADFRLPPGDWNATALPGVPLGLPSALLQRRPDIAAAERRVAAANAQIGVARAAFFPSLTLSGNAGQGAARIGDLFNASAFTWSLGVALAQTLFDAGARSARVDQARAGWEQSVAQYRQTVLGALQNVEDQLVAARVLEQQQALRRQASEAADQTEQQVMNRYRAGQVGYTDVVSAQASALSARRALIQAGAARQASAVALIQALGGGWNAQSLASAH
ncbi:MAG TPA: efflux transporter outer membrane subunit [Albitalea sp.]|uniref:efflux transporter outer membrane subunit n=1 Tax=Piscinibacter sp. TaxID=1903157 RepID=UPI002ED40D30